MKSNFKYILIIVLIGTVFSCQKKTINKETLDSITPLSESQFSFNVEIDNNMLNFPTRDDYEGAIEYLGPKSEDSFVEWENSIGFTSMRVSLTEEEREKRGILDNLLATLINDEGRISIGGNVFTLNALAETVSVVSNSNFNSEESGKNLTIYSTDDNILDIIEGTDVPLTGAERSSYCEKRKLSWNLPVNLASAKVVYQKAGFLNSLQSKLQNDSSNLFNLGLKTNGSNNFWRNKKTSGSINYSSSFFDVDTRSFRPYYSSRRLNAYRFSVEFRVQSKSYSGTQTGINEKIITIDCN